MSKVWSLLYYFLIFGCLLVVVLCLASSREEFSKYRSLGTEAKVTTSSAEYLEKGIQNKYLQYGEERGDFGHLNYDNVEAIFNGLQNSSINTSEPVYDTEGKLTGYSVVLESQNVKNSLSELDGFGLLYYNFRIEYSGSGGFIYAVVKTGGNT